MEHKTLSKFKWFWAWEDEKEEAWLRQMSQSGWRLSSIGFPGIYWFDRAEPADTIYRMDFNIDSKNYPAYLRLFEDAGWEHVLAYGSWQYFRIAAKPGENPEIFTDNTSKITKYQRVMALLVVFLPIWLMLLRIMQKADSLIYLVPFAFFLMLLLVYVFAIVMLIRRISQLKRMRE